MQPTFQPANVAAADEVVHGHVGGESPYVCIDVENLAVAADGPEVRGRLGAVAARSRLSVKVPYVAQAPVLQDASRDGCHYGRHCLCVFDEKKGLMKKKGRTHTPVVGRLGKKTLAGLPSGSAIRG